MSGWRDFLANYKPDDKAEEPNDLTEVEFQAFVAACMAAPDPLLIQCPCGLLHNHRPDVDRYVCPACGAIVIVPEEAPDEL